MLRPSIFVVLRENPFHAPAVRERHESEGISALLWALQKPGAKGGGRVGMWGEIMVAVQAGQESGRLCSGVLFPSLPQPV